MFFTPLVRYPRTKPNPFMQKAVVDARSKLDETFTQLWLEVIN
jgi:hypothetical protein